jgi:aminoglycoside phosphotransferase (APT) family kinase protein
MIESMFAPITGRAALGDVATVDGGLVNTLLRVTTAEGADYALRVPSPDPDDVTWSARFDVEVALLRRLSRTLPVPSPIVADRTGIDYGVPYLIYRWIAGITLNDCRRNFGHLALPSLAEPIGHVMGSIASAIDVASELPLRQLIVSEAIDAANRQLESALVHARLGTELAMAMREGLDRNRCALEAADSQSVVHGDFSGRNVIVRPMTSNDWVVSGVLDWETASIGSPLWDLGSLFRYARRYDADFRCAFERGYRTVKCELPDEWWYLGRLLDATRLVATLAEDRELPHVFDDCRAILTDLAGTGPTR